jgi:hypothetical protein
MTYDANSYDAIASLLESNSEIKTLRFFNFSTSTKLQQRRSTFAPHEIHLIDQALDTKNREGIRFWEAMLRVLAKEGASTKELIAEVFYHQPNRDYLYVDRADIRTFSPKLNGGAIALNSKVLLHDGSSRHLSLLDFKIRSGPQALQLAENCISALGLRGFLLDSGRSYHFIGVDPVTESALLELLAKFVLLHPIADAAWAAHQSIERSASLRVSSRDGKSPQVIRRVGLD